MLVYWRVGLGCGGTWWKTLIGVRFDFGWLAGHTSEAPKILKISCTISFWLTNKIHPCVFFSQKKRTKQPCEKKLFKRTVWFGLPKSVWLFVCLFVCSFAFRPFPEQMPGCHIWELSQVGWSGSPSSCRPVLQLPSCHRAFH